MTAIKHPLVLIATFIWIGFIGAISFMEAWIKFRAPGVSLAAGLSIGRLVFDALNKVEWVLAVLIFLNLLLKKSLLLVRYNWSFYLVVTLLILQTFWLLPALDVRASLVMQFQTVPPSHFHFYFVGMEVIKVVCLFVFGVLQFNKQTDVNVSSQ